MKEWLKKRLPPSMMRAYYRLRRHLEDWRNARRTPQEVFSEIYKDAKWGKFGHKPFHSGSGSASNEVVGPYVDRLGAYLRDRGPCVVVDLGCGDFTVGQHLVPYCSQYVGVDVVPNLISYLRSTVRNHRVNFLQLDIADGDLPQPFPRG